MFHAAMSVIRLNVSSSEKDKSSVQIWAGDIEKVKSPAFNVIQFKTLDSWSSPYLEHNL